MPAKGRFEASPLVASVASLRTWLVLDQLDAALQKDFWKARLELLKSKLVIVIID
jgi:hypothetical protein